ncbi:MAG: hypothetical protein ACI9OJ_001715, partial [Myxococcota bacterium]
QVDAGKQATVKAHIKAGKGALKVVANVAGATVLIDGEPVGQVPYEGTNLVVGQHMLEVMARAYESLQQTITIEGGMRRFIGVKLEPLEGAGETIGTVIATSTTSGARVMVDGRDRGPVPVSIDVSSGVHEIEISAPGHQPYRTRCTVEGGARCTRSAVLFKGDARLVLAGVEGASLRIGAVEVGHLPYDGGAPIGPQTLTVEAAGYDRWTRKITVAAGPSQRIVAELEADRSIPDREWQPGGFVLLHSGLSVPQGVFAVDVSAGWVHLLAVQFDLGIMPYLDVGATISTFGRLTEFELHSRFSWRPHEYFALGGRVRVGGGAGPRDVDTGFVLVEALGSFTLRDRLALTLIVGFDFHSDGYSFSETDADIDSASTGRQNTIGLRIGGSVDVAIAGGVSAWANIEWTGLKSQSRRVLGDLFGSGDEATTLMFRLGATYAF